MKKRFLTTARIIILGFLSVVAVGTLLLCLPFASAGEPCSFMNCLFTATSAVCVTGLVVVNTATQWSFFGQFVILVLIQIGGLGVVTVAMSLIKVTGRKIGLGQRSLMQESVAAPEIRGIVKFTHFIFIGTFLIELIGALVMSPVFIADFGFFKGLWMSIFHSVSAFCNAGFDILGTEQPFVSLTGYAYNPVINIAIMLLIVVGGLGFLTWNDIKTHGVHLKRYRMQSKVILSTTALLIIIPAAYYFAFEFDYLPFGKRLLVSLFQAVTPRTAGFNTVNLNEMSEAAHLTDIFLMLIGGSPGSTAGGMKTTTFAVLVLSSAAVFRKREDTCVFRRRISHNAVRQAAAIALSYFMLFFVGGICVYLAEGKGLPLLSCLYESASAIGTVGLTLGITPSLGVFSKIVLMTLMFVGRVGALTMIYATVSTANNAARLPEDKLSVG